MSSGSLSGRWNSSTGTPISTDQQTSMVSTRMSSPVSRIKA
jgi:hypothetical protein